jgi:hypothetical protein
MATSSEWSRDCRQALIVAAMNGDASTVTSLLAVDLNITDEVSSMSLDSQDVNV